jgi:menaquinone-9 beta-reductase
VTNDLDVVVIGAGPAGCWAARTLATLGAHVALVDGSHPREKPCGGGVTGRALSLVADAVERSTLSCAHISSARFVDRTRESSACVALQPGDLDVASRTDFDGALFSAATAAGARAVSARVVDVTRDGASFLIRTTSGSLRASRLIGADGANSIVRRKLARPFARADLSMATGYFVHGTTSDEIVLELLVDPPGYIWSFPRPTHLAVGICTQADEGITASALRATTREWLRSMKLDNGALAPYSWPIPSLSPRSFDALTTSGPGWCLAGDAAGLVDPITREGIYFALLSGQWAAEALASADEPHRRYRERVRDEIVVELALAARFKAGFFKPRFTRLLVDALGESRRVRQVMAGLIAGTQPYKTLKWTLARTAEFGLAWRWLRAGW